MAIMSTRTQQLIPEFNRTVKLPVMYDEKFKCVFDANNEIILQVFSPLEEPADNFECIHSIGHLTAHAINQNYFK